MATGKTIALTRHTFVSKVMSLLFNTLSSFLPSSKCLLISWLQSPSAVVLEPRKIKSVMFPLFPHLFAMSDGIRCHDLSNGKESACNEGDLGSIPGSGISPGEGNGNSFQYSCLENPMDRGPWWVTVQGVAESDTVTINVLTGAWEDNFIRLFSGTFFCSEETLHARSPDEKQWLKMQALDSDWLGCEISSPHHSFSSCQQTCHLASLRLSTLNYKLKVIMVPILLLLSLTKKPGDNWPVHDLTMDQNPRDVGGRLRMGEHMCTPDWFMSMYGKYFHNVVIILQFK